MSTDWGYRCVTHDADSEINLNHGEDLLRELWNARTLLRQLHDTGLELEVTHWRLDRLAPGLPGWLVEHAECDIILLNEYGAEEPIKAGDCPFTVYVGGDGISPRNVQCQRGIHTSGPHRFRARRHDEGAEFTIVWEVPR